MYKPSYNRDTSGLITLIITVHASFSFPVMCDSPQTDATHVQYTLQCLCRLIHKLTVVLYLSEFLTDLQ